MGLVLGTVYLVLEKQEMVTMRGKGRGEAGEVTRVVADAPVMVSLGKAVESNPFAP